MRAFNSSTNSTRGGHKTSMRSRWTLFQATTSRSICSLRNAATSIAGILRRAASCFCTFPIERSDLEPVARGLARHLGWEAVPFVSRDDSETGESSATWVLMTANSGFLLQAGIAGEASGWTNPQRPPLIWTDDFASFWHVLRFR